MGKNEFAELANLAKLGQVIVGALSRAGVGLQLKSREFPAQVGMVGNYEIEEFK